MSHEQKGPAEAATSPDRGSHFPKKETKMNIETNSIETMAAPVLGRRKFLAFAGAGSSAILPTVALAAADKKTHRLPQTIERRLEDCVAELRDILGEMHPHAAVHQHYLSSRPDGSFRFSLQGDVTFEPWQGDGVYLVSVDGWPHEYLVREERVIALSGKDMGYSHFFGRARAEDGGWDDFERFLGEKFVRKIGEVPA